MARSARLDLGINGAFLTRRWEEPENWMRLTAELGYPYHEFCADVIDPFFSGDEGYQLETAAAVAEAANRYGVKVWDIYTGVATHRFHGLAHADARVREYDIHVTASGTPQQPRVLLSSEPSLPEADIVTLLTLGVVARDFDRTGTQSLTGLALDAAYNASGINEQIRTLLPENEILKDATFRVSSAYSEVSGNIEPMAQFETRFLVDGLKLRAQTSLLGGRNRQAQAAYQIDEVFGAQLQWDSEKPSAPSFGDIGVDATARKEWP